MNSEMNKVKKFSNLSVPAFSVLFLIAAAVFLFFEEKNGVQIEIGDTKIQAIVAISESDKEKGLSGREKISENEGMLFVFDESGIYPFWMKDMLISIDMLWLDENKKVITIIENASPESYPMTFVSKLPAKYVVETSAGFSKRHKIATGSEVFFNF